MTASLASVMWVWQIRGGDSENMPLTRRAQTDLWIQQHPANCSNPSVQFGIIDWVLNVGHGMGSQLHIVSGVLSEVLKSGRVAVLSNKWARAMHDGCQGDDKGRLDCYFFPSAAEECSRIALEYFNRKMSGRVKLDKSSREAVVSQLASSEQSSSFVKDSGRGSTTMVTSPYLVIQEIDDKPGRPPCRRWQDPWAETPESIELNGQAVHWKNAWKYRSWWRAQSMRYILRWPSQYMCSILNGVRQDSYGVHVAHKVLAARRATAALQVKLPGLGGNRSVGDGLAGTLWAEEEAFIPRPIASIHIRQGDKGKEMKLVSFHTFLWAAEQVRYHVPNLHTAWLSTEQQQVIDETQRFGRWRFLYTDVPRQSLFNVSMMEYETMGGLALMTGQAFANLLIASECDYFVGVLGSNWNRLINELRLTNGRQLNGYIALNNREV
eukprot:SM000004S15137  [mRNA]  locus=s4:1424409:1426561:- [translate_table: standard]